MGCSYSNFQQQDEFVVQEQETQLVEDNANVDLFTTPEKKRVSSVRFSLLLDRNSPQSSSKPKKSLALLHPPSPKYDEQLLVGRTFLQSPLTRKLHFNMNLMTPKKPKRCVTRDSGEFSVSSTEM